MDMLKKFFPLSFKEKTTANLVITIIIYVVLPTILGIVTGIIGAVVGLIPIIGAIVIALLGGVSSLIGIYCLAGIVIAVLNFLDVLK
nr:hypothetical protein [Clostridia bacterium]